MGEPIGKFGGVYVFGHDIGRDLHKEPHLMPAARRVARRCDATVLNAWETLVEADARGWGEATAARLIEHAVALGKGARYAIELATCLRRRSPLEPRGE